MKVFFALDNRLKTLGPTAVAIGNFDGLHLGHQRILHTLTEEAARAKLCSLVLTFSPHPEKVLGKEPILMIQTLTQRLEGFRHHGLEAALVVPFNDNFFRLDPEKFVTDILVRLLQARLVIVGENFRFGQDRQGDGEFLRRAGKKLGFAVQAIPPVIIEGKVVSSSLIRELLENGQTDLASVYLGRPYEIVGSVVRGNARGQSLGLPTANIMPENEILPAGVFITESQLEDKTFPSVTNIGTRPTFAGEEKTVESHLLGFRGHLYGRTIRTLFHKKIREEKKFNSAAELRHQILQDIEAALSFLAGRDKS